MASKARTSSVTFFTMVPSRLGERSVTIATIAHACALTTSMRERDWKTSETCLREDAGNRRWVRPAPRRGGGSRGEASGAGVRWRLAGGDQGAKGGGDPLAIE